MTNGKTTTLDTIAAIARLDVRPGEDHDRTVAEAVAKPIPGIPPIKLARACGCDKKEGGK